MFPDLIMFYFIYSTTFYICQKSLKQPRLISLSTCKVSILCILLTFLSYFLKTHIPILTYLLPLILIWLLFAISIEKPQIIISTIISFGLSYCIWGISSLIIVLTVANFRHIHWIQNHSILSVLVALLHMLLSYFLFKIKRFKNGIPHLLSYTSLNGAMILSTIFILFLIFRTSTKNNLFIGTLSIFIFVFTLALIIHWWQAQITKSYKRSLQLREFESLRMELEEKEKRIVELEKQNEELGRLIHKDNKLIPAMEHAVHEYFITDFETLDEAKNKAQGLLLEIETLSKNRSNIIVEIHNVHSKHYETGVPSVDTLLNYMDKRARQEHISLSVHLGVDLTSYVPNTIAAEDLTHMLSDLLENAIIASKGKTNANIQLQFYISEKAFVIEIADNGVPFEIESLVNFGITQLTTHADSGGSGIGLMDIWKIKEKYFASLHIAELDANAPFTKKIAIIFNKKHRYSISSNRKDQLIAACKRADLHIFD